ncbi:MAG: hypothetical protein ACOC0Z_00945 [Halohasta sp.]
MFRPPQSSIARLLDRQPTLWLLVVASFGVGDLVSTVVGLRLPGVVEAGPVAAPVFDRYGLAGMVGLKLVTIVAGYGCWRALPAPHRVGVPLGLAVVGVAVTGWNTVVVSAALWL